MRVIIKHDNHRRNLDVALDCRSIEDLKKLVSVESFPGLSGFGLSLNGSDKLKEDGDIKDFGIVSGDIIYVIKCNSVEVGKNVIKCNNVEVGKDVEYDNMGVGDIGEASNLRKDGKGCIDSERSDSLHPQPPHNASNTQMDEGVDKGTSDVVVGLSFNKNSCHKAENNTNISNKNTTNISNNNTATNISNKNATNIPNNNATTNISNNNTATSISNNNNNTANISNNNTANISNNNTATSILNLLQLAFHQLNPLPKQQSINLSPQFNNKGDYRGVNPTEFPDPQSTTATPQSTHTPHSLPPPPNSPTDAIIVMFNAMLLSDNNPNTKGFILQQTSYQDNDRDNDMDNNTANNTDNDTHKDTHNDTANNTDNDTHNDTDNNTHNDTNNDTHNDTDNNTDNDILTYTHIHFRDKCCKFQFLFVELPGKTVIHGLLKDKNSTVDNQCTILNNKEFIHRTYNDFNGAFMTEEWGKLVSMATNQLIFPLLQAARKLYSYPLLPSLSTLPPVIFYRVMAYLKVKDILNLAEVSVDWQRRMMEDCEIWSALGSRYFKTSTSSYTGQNSLQAFKQKYLSQKREEDDERMIRKERYEREREIVRQSEEYGYIEREIGRNGWLYRDMERFMDI